MFYCSWFVVEYFLFFYVNISCLSYSATEDANSIITGNRMTIITFPRPTNRCQDRYQQELISLHWIVVISQQ